MRSARASSVRDAGRRAEAEQHDRADRSPDRRSLRRQERLDSVAGSAFAEDPSGCFPPSSTSRSTAIPSVVFSPACDVCEDPEMNTLAAQTAACTTGSNYSINRATHCECSQDNRGNGNVDNYSNHHSHGNHCHANQCHGNRYPADPEDDVFSMSINSQRTRQEMRWELRYFFMNPYLKYKKRGRIPWKLSVQVLKIIFVTMQLIFFGISNNSLNDFYEGNREAFEHMFLKGWSSGFDSTAYPRSDILYAVYELQSFYEHLDHVAYQFAHLKENALGTYGYDQRDNNGSQLHVWQENYEKIKIADGRFYINQSTTEESLSIMVSEQVNISVKDYMQDHNQTINADTLRLLRLNFVVGSLHLKDSKTFIIPDCIIFNLTIEYNNIPHNGRLSIKLDMKHEFFTNCSNTYRDEVLETVPAKMMVALDTFIIVLCLVSALMCLRSFMRAQRLKIKTVGFFNVQYNVDLSLSDRLEFLNLWYVLIIVNDACTIAGSVCKILLESRNNTNYDSCSLLLGTGCFLVWFGVLRYLSFFDKYNMLILTLKTAMPSVLRFLLCTGIIYAAYAFFGWIVLGPYHPKFRTLEISMECMYSLINGDDMYATFREMSDRNPTIYFFSRIYLYTFISVFIYVVLSLIIAVIMDTYETIKEYQRTGYVEGRLRSFMCENCDDEDIPGRGSFHTQSSMFERGKSKWRNALKRVDCCKRCNTNEDDDDDGLIT